MFKVFYSNSGLHFFALTSEWGAGAKPPEPSRADIDITAKLKKALAHVDIRVLDHIISTNSHCVSLAERGEI